MTYKEIYISLLRRFDIEPTQGVQDNFHNLWPPGALDEDISAELEQQLPEIYKCKTREEAFSLMIRFAMEVE